MKVIFLDCDGVINDHTKHDNGYCGTKKGCVDNLNYLLKVPGTEIVISSSWRYAVHNGWMTLGGLGYLLQTHGLCLPAIGLTGITETDEAIVGKRSFEYLRENGAAIRKVQIMRYLEENYDVIESYVVLDDIDLKIENQVKTEYGVGLTFDQAIQAAQILTKEVQKWR